MEMNKKGEDGLVMLVGVVFIIIMIVLGLVVFPIYNVWSKEMNGKATLKEAEWDRQVAIQEANAVKESSSLLAEAEIIRAGGIAEANRIISDSLTTEYIKYKFVEGLNDGNTEVIYVPTEANLPILEARDKNE